MRRGKSHWRWLAALLAWPCLLVSAAGMDSDTSRPKAADYTTTTKANRYTTPSGSMEMDNGMVVKWGTASVPGGLTPTATVTFTTPFPNSALSVEVAAEDTTVIGVFISTSAPTTTGFTVNVECFILGAVTPCAGATTVYWSARGY